MSVPDYLGGSHNPIDFFRCIFSKMDFDFLNPDYFSPYGQYLFCGEQGSGKTLSAVLACRAMMAAYPRAVVCSNLDLYGLPEDVTYIPFTDVSQLYELDNGIDGLIFLLDEIQLVWNSLESRKMSVSDIAVFCQMRKSRRVILGTSQVYGRVAKPLREQMRYIISCKNYLNYIQVNTVFDPCADFSGLEDADTKLSAGKELGKYWFFHSPRAYMMYDTTVRIEARKA